MKKNIHTEIQIHAEPEKVWEILTDFDRFPSWNPFIPLLTGTVEVGNTITVRIEPPGGKGMTFRPKIVAFQKAEKLSWLGHFLFKGLFDGAHSFQLIDNGNGTTTFIQSEHFSGLLVRLLQKQLEINTKQGFEAMNTALKERAERKD